jgi:hypothetical protein
VGFSAAVGTSSPDWFAARRRPSRTGTGPQLRTSDPPLPPGYGRIPTRPHPHSPRNFHPETDIFVDLTPSDSAVNDAYLTVRVLQNQGFADPAGPPGARAFQKFIRLVKCIVLELTLTVDMGKIRVIGLMVTLYKKGVYGENMLDITSRKWYVGRDRRFA